MKRTLLLFLLLLPFFGIAQTVDLASWALTANGNATTKQTYVQSAVFLSNQNKNVYGSTGALVSGWDNNAFEHYRFVEISITPTTGNVIWISNLIFQQASIPNGGTPGPSTYIAKYYIADNGSIPGTFDFYNNASSLVSEESRESRESGESGESGEESEEWVSSSLIISETLLRKKCPGIISIKELATPITGLSKSASLSPVARNRALCGVRWYPRFTSSRLRCSYFFCLKMRDFSRLKVSGEILR